MNIPPKPYESSIHTESPILPLLPSNAQELASFDSAVEPAKGKVCTPKLVYKKRNKPDLVHQQLQTSEPIVSTEDTNPNILDSNNRYLLKIDMIVTLTQIAYPLP